MVGMLKDLCGASQTNILACLLEEPVFLGDGACLSESVLLGYKLPGWIMN